MKLKLVLPLLLAVGASAQTIAPGPPAPPPASTCGVDSTSFVTVAAYLYTAGNWEQAGGYTAIAQGATYTGFQYALGQTLAVMEQKIAFVQGCLKAAGYTVPASPCEPGVTMPSPLTATNIANQIVAEDADQGDLYILPFFNPAYDSSTPPNGWVPETGLQNYLTNTEGAYCNVQGYAVHPAQVEGLKLPVF